jgi:hypothetical protein
MEASPSSPRRMSGEVGGFMADTHCSHHCCQEKPTGGPRFAQQQEQEGWKVVTCRKQWQWVVGQVPPPPQPHRQVSTDLIGHCFNYLRPDHIVVDCTYNSCCLRCHREGHQVRICKRPSSPESVGPPPRQPRPLPVAVVNPKVGDIVLVAPAPRRAIVAGPSRSRGHVLSGSGIPPGASASSTP